MRDYRRDARAQLWEEAGSNYLALTNQAVDERVAVLQRADAPRARHAADRSRLVAIETPQADERGWVTQAEHERVRTAKLDRAVRERAARGEPHPYDTWRAEVDAPDDEEDDEEEEDRVKRKSAPKKQATADVYSEPGGRTLTVQALGETEEVWTISAENAVEAEAERILGRKQMCAIYNAGPAGVSAVAEIALRGAR